MSRMYYYSRINRGSRRKGSGNFKIILLGSFLIIAAYVFSFDIEPKIQLVEKEINDQVEQIDQIVPAE